ncbi:MAG: DUF6152 family protein [Steroidobacteraceae bacterium]
MQSKTALRLLTGLMALTAPLLTQAHHSFAMFDSEHQIRVEGVVSDYKWQNPHVYIWLTAPDAKGENRTWMIECANPGILNRLGWKFNMIKPNDRITVVIAPLRTGEPGALLKQVKLADGSKFGNGGPAGPATIPID